MRGPPRHWPHAPIALLCVGCVLAACTPPLPVSGLKPVNPPAERGWPAVTSIQPTLRWEALRLNEEGGLAGSKDIGISDPRYDLRIWREKHGRPVELVYERRDLDDNVHKLAHPLQPAARYSWTVRARFNLNGELRVSPWMIVGRRHKTGVIKIPSDFYLGFETPPADPDSHKIPRR